MNKTFKKYFCCEKCFNLFTTETLQNIWTKRLVSEKTGKVVSGVDKVFCPDCGSLDVSVVGSDSIL